MTSISSHNAATTLQLPVMLPPRGINSDALKADPSLQGSGKTDELRERFTQFLGESFYGQMLKAMRSTVGKPAYFHGGRAEEVFQGQLDQTMAEQLTKTSASKFAEPMFERQFPTLAKPQIDSSLHQLENLRRA